MCFFNLKIKKNDVWDTLLHTKQKTQIGVSPRSPFKSSPTQCTVFTGLCIVGVVCINPQLPNYLI